jgi:putative hemolysin
VTTLVYIGIVVALIVVEGLFVASELALVSLREGQVRALAEQGGRRGTAVSRLVSDPNRYLASVQIGVTVTALLSSAFGAVTLSEQATAALHRVGMSSRLAGVAGFLGVTILIAFVTLVIGELAPKRLALQRAEGTARLVAPTLNRMAMLTQPVIWVLSKCTDVVVRLLGGDPATSRERISEEELRGLVAAHESLTQEERTLIDEVFAAGERQVREVLLPRTEVVFLDASLLVAQAARIATDSPHSRFPVVRGSNDDVVGFVHVKDLFPGDAGAPARRVGEIARDVKLLPSTKKVLVALSEMRREGHHLAIVVDEYGGTAGIVTLEDLIEEVIGEIRDEYDAGSEPTRTLRGGDIEVDGLLNLDEFAELTETSLPDGPYETVAGFVMARLGHVPELGESVEYEDSRLTVTVLDGRRVARVRVSANPVPDPTPAGSAAPPAPAGEPAPAATAAAIAPGAHGRQ